MSRRFTRIPAMLMAVAVLGGGLSAAVTGLAATPAGAYPTTEVLFEGHGWGHGRGLGQYGSYGYAVDHGWDYGRILDHFYGGTTAGSKADGIIDVKLEFLDGTTSAPTDMTVTSGGGFTIGTNTYGAGEWGRVRWNGNGWTIERAAACGGPWTEAQKLANTTLQPEAIPTQAAGDDLTKMITVLQPASGKACTDWNRRTYRGTLRIARLDTVFTRVLNRVAMEQYLRGVVPRESPASWGDAGGGKGLHALKAQAVAARSYAWAENRSVHYKTCDTISCQVYGGAGLNGSRSEDARTDRAVAETAGEVRMKGSAIARTEFSSSTGGHTAGGEFTAVPDDGDDTPGNPNHDWDAKVPVTKVQQAYPTIGTLRSIGIVRRNGLGAQGGRVLQVQVVGDKATVTDTGNGMRSKLGLLSDWFTVVDVIIDVTRLQGDDRAATAAAVSRDLFADGAAQAAVLASSATYADAVVGAPLAKARTAPILLTGKDGVPAATMTELQRATGGGTTVYLLGAEGVIGPGVASQLQSAGYTVVRYGGPTRYATAVLVAEALGNPSTVLVATGLDFADALSAGAAAAKEGGAILLSRANQQADETAAYLQAHPPSAFFAVGGAAAAAHRNATPLEGADRYETALKVANRFFPGPVVAGLASGVSYFDALSGGVHASTKGGPLVLTHTTNLPVSTRQYLQGNSDVTLRTVYVYGGKNAIADAVITALRDR